MLRAVRCSSKFLQMSNRNDHAARSQSIPTLARALAVLVLLATMCTVAAAQSDASSYGRQFHVVFPDTTMNRLRVLFNRLQTTAQISIVALDTTQVTVTGPGYARSVTVFPDRSTTLELSGSGGASTIFPDSIGTPQRLSFRVDASAPVAITAYFATLFGAESFTPLPVERWGTEYFAASLHQLWVYNAAQLEEINTIVPAPSSLVVVASEDGTDVTIETTTDVVGAKLRTVRLDAGQTYLVETFPFVDAVRIGRPDITGTRITSTKPVGVLSGNTRTLGSLYNPLPREPLPWNAMANCAFEWLHPTGDHGHTFIYRQFSAVEERATTEIVRVVGTAPGITTVTITNGGPPMTVGQGEFLDFPSTVFRNDTVPQPFAVRTDKPAQCFVFTGSWSKYVGTNDSTEMETTTWAPAMAELVPREQWITFARYNAPAYPGGGSHYIIIAADSGTSVFVDGNPVAFDARSVTGTTYRHARVLVGAGDHTLRALGGRFTATAFGQLSGYAAYVPLGAASDGAERDGIALHPTVYLERLAVAYAMPVPGVSDLTVPNDSIVIARLDRCDSSVVVANRIGSTWSSGIIEASVNVGGYNVDIAIVKTFDGRVHDGFRIRFVPLDDTQDAAGSVTVISESGQRWSIPYVYSASTVALTPSQFDLLAIPAGEMRTTPLTLTNRKPFTTTVLDARLRYGDRGFVLQGRSIMPKPLASGGSFGLILEFTGATANTLYTDTLVVYSDCDSMVIPLSARTAPSEPAPLPLITGYDWGTRRVGGVSDTLSFISNAGTLPYDIERIVVIDDPSNAFAIVPPAASVTVPPAERTSTGIRFQPPTAGLFTAEILLVTTDGDSARALLRGDALVARIDFSDVGPIDVCTGRSRDTIVTLAATGMLAVRIDSFVVSSTPNVLIEIDTADLSLPRNVAPGEQMSVSIRIVAMEAGAFDATIVAVAASIGDSVARINGTIARCATLGVTTTDYDFDTVLVAHERTGSVSIINTGDADVAIQSMQIVDDVDGVFAILPPTSPSTLARAATIDVSVAFRPSSTGNFSARVRYETSAGTVYSALRGVGAVIVLPAHIIRAYRGEPGDEVSIAVELDRDTYVGTGAPINVTVQFDTTLLDFIALRDTGAAQVGLTPLSSQPGSVSFAMQPTADTLRAGAIAALRFLVRITLKDSSELPLALSSATPWLVFQTRPGLFVRMPWCGLAARLFEFTAGALALRPVRPNPVRGNALIEFSLPLDGRVTITVIDALGAERHTVVDESRSAGSHEAMLSSGTLPRGAYRLRMRTSGMETTVGFVIE